MPGSAFWSSKGMAFSGPSTFALAIWTPSGSVALVIAIIHVTLSVWRKFAPDATPAILALTRALTLVAAC